MPKNSEVLSKHEWCDWVRAVVVWKKNGIGPFCGLVEGEALLGAVWGQRWWERWQVLFFV